MAKVRKLCYIISQSPAGKASNGDGTQFSRGDPESGMPTRLPWGTGSKARRLSQLFYSNCLAGLGGKPWKARDALLLRETTKNVMIRN